MEKPASLKPRIRGIGARMKLRSDLSRRKFRPSDAVVSTFLPLLRPPRFSTGLDVHQVRCFRGWARVEGCAYIQGVPCLSGSRVAAKAIHSWTGLPIARTNIRQDLSLRHEGCGPRALWALGLAASDNRTGESK
jgi:hypothetical protein